jgi:hypothetical protein
MMKELEEKNVTEGLDFILNHLRKPVWPKTISTKTTEGRQIPVHSKQEALAWYKASNFLDCRISAYPYYGKHVVDPTYMIDFLMIDSDLSNFRSGQAFERARNKTLKKIKETFGTDFTPTVLWSGNGYHIYIPIESRYVLEKRPEFSRFEEPSKQYLRFAEWYLSSGNADSNHYKNISFGNCMLRIPGSHNFKCVQRNKGIIDYSTQVRIRKEWNGRRPPAHLLIGSFFAYLVDQKIKEIHQRKRRSQYRHNYNESSISSIIPWIEELLHTPLPDHRKYCIWRILAPYLINVRRLSYEESFNLINDWLDEGSRLKRLNFNTKPKINEALRRVGYYRPISLQNLGTDNRKLYSIVSR